MLKEVIKNKWSNQRGWGRGRVKYKRTKKVTKDFLQKIIELRGKSRIIGKVLKLKNIYGLPIILYPLKISFKMKVK